jgi:PAS domain S-box-containing protein
MNETFLGTYENLLNLIHSEDRSKFDIELRNALGTQEEIKAEFRVPRNYGYERVLRLKGKIYRDTLEKPIHITGTITDITEEKQSQDIMSRFFTLSVDLFCVANKDGYFTQLSPTWVDALGYSLEELAGHPFMYFVHPMDRKRTQAEFQILISQGHRTINFENRYRCKDGRYRNLLWNAVSLPDDSTIYAIARDITDLRIESLRRAPKFVGVQQRQY